MNVWGGSGGAQVDLATEYQLLWFQSLAVENRGLRGAGRSALLLLVELRDTQLTMPTAFLCGTGVALAHRLRLCEKKRSSNLLGSMVSVVLDAKKGHNSFVRSPQLSV